MRLFPILSRAASKEKGSGEGGFEASFTHTALFVQLRPENRHLNQISRLVEPKRELSARLGRFRRGSSATPASTLLVFHLSAQNFLFKMKQLLRANL